MTEREEGRVEGMNRAIKMARQIWKMDFENAQKEGVSEDDQDRALNCSMRMGQFISHLKDARNAVTEWTDVSDGGEDGFRKVSSPESESR